MLGLAAIFFVLGCLASLLGFTTVTGASYGAVQIPAAVFLVAALLFGIVGSRRPNEELEFSSNGELRQRGGPSNPRRGEEHEEGVSRR
jgi:uncharacterized membrane protein YtjA (UPF0391 family)